MWAGLTPNRRGRAIPFLFDNLFSCVADLEDFDSERTPYGSKACWSVKVTLVRQRCPPPAEPELLPKDARPGR